MKTTEKPLKHLYRQLVNSAPNNLGSHRTNAPRDPKQFQNAQQNLRAEKRMTRDSLYNLLLKLLKLDSSNDLWFTRISWWLVMTKISWKNLRWWSIGPICHHFILHVLQARRFLCFVPSFLWKEFEEKQYIPAIYLINDRKIEETHDFFCNTFLAPELNNAKKLYLVADHEASVIKATKKKHLPEIDLFRCSIHAKNDVKRKL